MLGYYFFMQKDVKDKIIEILKESLNAIAFNKPEKLRELSDKIIHSASIYQDDNVVSVSVLIYALSKIYERKNYRNCRDWEKFNQLVVVNLKKAAETLEKDNDSDYYKAIKGIFESINSLDRKLKLYIEQVFEKAKVHRASRLHEHGISIGRTADILGISKWEIMDYIGSTGISDVRESKTIPIDKRLKKARELFSS